MPSTFRLRATSAFEQDVRMLTGRDQGLLHRLAHIFDILEKDPYNRNRRYNIRKLKDVKFGEGQWRIRFGKYRLRYDVIEQDVVLYSFSHRKEAY